MDWSVNVNLAAPPPTAQHSRLVSAAHQFEASMLSELMKPLQEDSLFADKGEEGEGGNALTGFASEALGRSLSEHGGLGIARQIIARLDTQPAAKPSLELPPSGLRQGR